MIRPVRSLLLIGLVLAAPSVSNAIYLNDQNITVALGPSMAAEPFANRTTAASLASIIDAPSASAAEFHNQGTHVWVSGGPLELVFDFQVEYDLTTLHFWNYHTESFDVDQIDFRFYDASNSLVGTLLGVVPALGGSSPSDSTPILAEDYDLSSPSEVRFVNAVLSGTNGQVDFNNLGFTGVESVPEPAATLLVLTALGLVAARNRAGSRSASAA